MCLFERNLISRTSPDTCAVNKMLFLTPRLWHMLCHVRTFKRYSMRGSALVLNIITGVMARARRSSHYDDIQHNSTTLSVILLWYNSSRTFTSAELTVILKLQFVCLFRYSCKLLFWLFIWKLRPVQSHRCPNLSAAASHQTLRRTQETTQWVLLK